MYNVVWWTSLLCNGTDSCDVLGEELDDEAQAVAAVIAGTGDVGLVQSYPCQAVTLRAHSYLV